MKRIASISLLLLLGIFLLFLPVYAAEQATADDSCPKCGGLGADTSSYFDYSNPYA